MPHKLLLADDSVTIQRVIELTFADEDIRVIAVGDGKQAIERIQTERPDIVLADIGMPERDGYEVAAFVKGNPEFAHVPVLLLTGAFEPIDEGRARAAGCDGVLVKPFEPQLVINRVKDLLAGRRPAGLWAATQTAQPSPAPTPPAPAAAGPRGTAPPDRTAGGSLDEYFDKLDAAFGELEASASPAGASPRPGPATGAGADALAGWDPDLAGDPPRPSGHEPPPSDAEPSPTIAPPAQPGRPLSAAPHVPVQPSPPVQAQPPVSAAADREPAPGPALPRGASLAEAFAALLSAERGHPIAPPAVRPQDIPDDTIEDIVRRVIDRMDAQAVRDTVVDVAERMVREEIERIKRGVDGQG